ncbi:hypothetical protein BJX99DRAFT_226592 [Aspergillus californicus]
MNKLINWSYSSSPICLTSLLAPSGLSLPVSTTQSHRHQTHQTLSLPPAAHISHSDQCTCHTTTRTDDYRLSLDPGCPEGRDLEPVSTILILNRCNHAFHTTCLRSWFEYRQYRCPICSDVLFSE